jgi:hypothetical protein
LPAYNTHRPLSVQDELLLKHVCSELERGPVLDDNALSVHRALTARMARMGAAVRIEFPMPYVGKSGPRQGRIDLFAKFTVGPAIAIEIDARKPRAASLLKLQSFNGLRISATRGVAGECPEGIDAVVAVPVRFSR